MIMMAITIKECGVAMTEQKEVYVVTITTTMAPVEILTTMMILMTVMQG
jgi:hypothetical protein